VFWGGKESCVPAKEGRSKPIKRHGGGKYKVVATFLKLKKNESEKPRLPVRALQESKR